MKPSPNFKINYAFLEQARVICASRPNLRWLVGGAGSGKTTITQRLSQKHNMPIYDMDAHIYGAYHSRFTPEKHPVNRAWAGAENGLAWLLQMTWDGFNAFNQAALPEYLDLFVQDLAHQDAEQPLLIDGGIVNPALLAQAIPSQNIVCLSNLHQTSLQIWTGSEERLAMKGFIDQLPEPEKAWETFLEFDQKITEGLLQESEMAGIAICARAAGDSVADVTERVAQILKI